MDDHHLMRNYGSATEEDGDVRKGPWTVEEDAILTDYVTIHGEGRWNNSARCAGLKRTGKSCRLRWLNYLRPNVRRGNITLQEQLLILELHSRWGNRWSKIAQYLPGRTDNEIKNYWRTRVQKQAKQLKCDVNSKQFRDAMRYIWMPRLAERIQAASGSSTGQPTTDHSHNLTPAVQGIQIHDPNIMPEPSVTSPDSFDTQVISPVSDVTEYQNPTSCSGYYYQEPDGVQNGSVLNPGNESGWWGWSKVEVEAESGGESIENFWNEENIWFLQQQLM